MELASYKHFGVDGSQKTLLFQTQIDVTTLLFGYQKLKGFSQLICLMRRLELKKLELFVMAYYGSESTSLDIHSFRGWLSKISLWQMINFINLAWVLSIFASPAIRTMKTWITYFLNVMLAKLFRTILLVCLKETTGLSLGKSI